MRFDGKVVLISGAGSGIGRATALGFGERGARVAVADIDGGKAEVAAEEIVKAGGGLRSGVLRHRGGAGRGRGAHRPDRDPLADPAAVRRGRVSRGEPAA